MTEGRMKTLTQGLSTKADKMRVLEREGFARADIARFLGVRYQQVRNTLEGDKRTGYKPEINVPAIEEVSSGNRISGFHQIEICEDGYGRIPPELIQHASDSCAELLAVTTDDGVFIGSPAAMIERVRGSLG